MHEKHDRNLHHFMIEILNKENLDPDGFNGEFCQTFKELEPVLLKVIQNKI